MLFIAIPTLRPKRGGGRERKEAIFYYQKPTMVLLKNYLALIYSLGEEFLCSIAKAKFQQTYFNSIHMRVRWGSLDRKKNI